MFRCAPTINRSNFDLVSKFREDPRIAESDVQFQPSDPRIVKAARRSARQPLSARLQEDHVCLLTLRPKLQHMTAYSLWLNF